MLSGCYFIRWILSKAKKDDVDEAVSKYDGEYYIYCAFPFLLSMSLISLFSLIHLLMHNSVYNGVCCMKIVVLFVTCIKSNVDQY